MGDYLYRVMAKKRKMASGEEVHEAKFVYKYTRWADPPIRGEKHIPETLIYFEREGGPMAGDEVSTISAGSNYWWDYNEGRTKIYGHLAPAGNRFTILRDLDECEVEALQLICNQKHMIHRGFGLTGPSVTLKVYRDNHSFVFELKSGDRMIYNKVAFFSGRRPLAYKVRYVADMLKEVYAKVQELDDAA